MNSKPWDARISAWLVRPLVHSAVHPNVLTTLRLLVGMSGAVLLASGTAFNLGALLIVISNFLDHTDGELARMSGKTSRFGHNYDLVSDAMVIVGLFVGLGFGLHGVLGLRSIAFGTIAGVAVAGIFHLRHIMEKESGKSAIQQAHVAGFETEDVLYLLPLVTLANHEKTFLLAAAVGAPVGLIIVAVQYFKRPKPMHESL